MFNTFVFLILCATNILCSQFAIWSIFLGNFGNLVSSTHLCCFVFHWHFSFEYLTPLGNSNIVISCYMLSFGWSGSFSFLSSFTTSRLDPENTLYILIMEEEWNLGPNEVSGKTPIDRPRPDFLPKYAVHNLDIMTAGFHCSNKAIITASLGQTGAKHWDSG